MSGFASAVRLLGAAVTLLLDCFTSESIRTSMRRPDDSGPIPAVSAASPRTITESLRHGPNNQWSRAVTGKTVSRRLNEREAELYRVGSPTGCISWGLSTI